jgi:hypothetical protein
MFLAEVNAAREAAFAIGGLACLVVAGMLITSVLLSRQDRPNWSGMRRAVWRLGALGGAVGVLAGAGLIAAWAGGADWSLSSGSTSSSAASFCSTHDCIPNFPNGIGFIVQCADGTWSHSGGIQGACSDHGGEQQRRTGPNNAREHL